MPDNHFAPENLTAWGSLFAAALAAALFVWRKAGAWLAPVFGVAQALLQLKTGHDLLTLQNKDHETRIRALEGQATALATRDLEQTKDLDDLRRESRSQTETLNLIVGQITTLAAQQAANGRQQDQMLNQLNILTEALLHRKD
jgi:hypothetical protein